jgi:hypothetical protein
VPSSAISFSSSSRCPAGSRPCTNTSDLAVDVRDRARHGVLADVAGSSTLIWRFRAERHDPTRAAEVEARPAVVIVAALALISAVLSVRAIEALAAGTHPGDSAVALASAALTAVVLTPLAYLKRHTGVLLASPALKGDGTLSAIGAATALFALVGLLLDRSLDWWWGRPRRRTHRRMRSRGRGLRDQPNQTPLNTSETDALRPALHSNRIPRRHVVSQTTQRSLLHYDFVIALVKGLGPQHSWALGRRSRALEKSRLLNNDTSRSREEGTAGPGRRCTRTRTHRCHPSLVSSCSAACLSRSRSRSRRSSRSLSDRRRWVRMIGSFRPGPAGCGPSSAPFARRSRATIRGARPGPVGDRVRPRRCA